MSIGTLLVSGSGAWVAAANGGNDNGKGVATVVGARVMDEGRALWLAHLATFCGAVASLLVSMGLIRTFQGSDLLGPHWAGTPTALGIVSAAAAATIYLATWLRIPISTTHALTGALVGTGLGLSGMVALAPLRDKFVLPLLASPLISAVLAGCAYGLLHRIRVKLGLNEESCLCLRIGPRRTWVPVAALADGSSAAAVGPIPAIPEVALQVGDASECRPRYKGTLLGVPAAGLLDVVHVCSAGSLSLARGLNDAPKLAALLVGLTIWWTPSVAVGVVAIAMLLGGWASARRVARTMSEGITDLNPGSATTANLVASALVILASFVALPVSTTHVTCGALFGIGVAQGRARWRTIGGILLAWVTTLPLAAGIAAAIAWITLTSAGL